MAEVSDSVKEHAAHQLVRLADLMETCERGSREYKLYSKDYKMYARLLFPKDFTNPFIKKKLRRPGRKFVATMKSCTCGSQKLKMTKDKDDKIIFSCPDCERAGEAGDTKEIARDNWNKTFI
jgi:hypothetical protein